MGLALFGARGADQGARGVVHLAPERHRVVDAQRPCRDGRLLRKESGLRSRLALLAHRAPGNSDRGIEEPGAPALSGHDADRLRRRAASRRAASGYRDRVRGQRAPRKGRPVLGVPEGVRRDDVHFQVVPDADLEAQLQRVELARVLQLVTELDPARRRALPGDGRVRPQVQEGRLDVDLQGVLLVCGVGNVRDLRGDQQCKQAQSSPRSPNSFIFICRLLREILSSFAVLVTFPFVTSRPRTIRSRSTAWTCSLTITLRGPGVVG